MREYFDRMEREFERVITGQKRVFRDILCAILASGHVLMEGVPGLGKTLIVRTLARVLNLSFRRIQFTPDLMPSDITGVSIYTPGEMEFRFSPGPVFCDLLLADEINRAPARTQSALLEVMEEYQVSAEGKSYPVPEFFTVIATQNPVEFEGTYPLPEAEVDRFILKVVIDYPEKGDEVSLLQRVGAGFDPKEELERVGGGEGPDHGGGLLGRAREMAGKVRVEEPVISYIYRIVERTRNHPEIFLGASTRGGISLLKVSRARALLAGRAFVTPDDVKNSLLPVMVHRILLNTEVEMQGRRVEDVLGEIFREVPVPR